MTFYLSIFSVLNHLTEFSAQFIIFILAMSPSVSAWFVSVYIFNFALKNLMNIFFLYTITTNNLKMLCLATFKKWSKKT